MKNIIAILALFISLTASSQYYYNDIIGAKEISARMKALKAARVQSITATGYDQRGAKSADFNEWQEVQNNGTVLKVTTRNGQQANRVYYTFDDNARLLSIRDSAAAVQSTTEYRYDEQDRLISIKTVTKDAGQDFNESSERRYTYSNGEQVSKMLRITNGNDSLEYTFTADENGYIVEERPSKRTIGIASVYYYYNDNGQVSDIVRYDKYSKRLLPDVMFEYDEAGHVIQRVTTLSTRPPDYLIFRYLFNDKGLKTKEAMFGKSEAGLSGETSLPKGRIEYSYNYVP